MWAVKHKSGTVLFVTNCERTANNRREMGWIVEEVKMASREQFEDFVRENLHPGASNAVIRICWQAWEASRAAIEKGAVVAYQDAYGNALSEGDFDGGADEMHETAFKEQWTPLIKADGLKVKQ